MIVLSWLIIRPTHHFLKEDRLRNASVPSNEVSFTHVCPVAMVLSGAADAEGL